VAVVTKPLVDLRIPVNVWIVSAPVEEIDVVAVAPKLAVFAEMFDVDAFVAETVESMVFPVTVRLDVVAFVVEALVAKIEEKI
jgi:hypothetical protein